MIELGVAIIGAVGTVVSAWLVHRVAQVRRAVNGHLSDLERQIRELHEKLDASSERL